MFDAIKRKLLGQTPKVVLPDITEYDLTPDAHRLSKYYAQLIFVYCSCQKGQSLSHLMGEQSQFLAHAFTEPEYVMWHTGGRSTSRFPIAMKETSPLGNFGEVNKFGMPARIAGQLWAVRPKYIVENLDKIKSNTIYFKRKRVQISVEYRRPSRHTTTGFTVDVFKQSVRAWMYEGRPEFWDDILYHYDKMPLLTRNKNTTNSPFEDRYYYYNENLLKK